MSEGVVWDGPVPVSVRFGEGYFSRAGGEGETRTIFLAGNGLPERWASFSGPVFRVGELGFGTGLNFRVTVEVWREFWRARQSSPSFDLEFVSVEGFPLSERDMVRAGWVEETWGRWDGGGQSTWARHYASDRVRVNVDVCDVNDWISKPLPKIHAWYLDGFSPAKNPSMWSAPVLSALARLSEVGTTVATFSAAGHVRRGLEAAGFRVEKRQGYAGKRESLSGVFSGAGSGVRV